MSDGLCSTPEVTTDNIIMKVKVYFVTAGGAVGIQYGLIFSKITVSTDFFVSFFIRKKER
ncbi:MAG: hypothetical protein ACOYO1_11770 [Bacteroidales bacterium]